MIDFYAFSTPNGRKVAIALEELGMDHKVIPVDISKGQQYDADFLKISPNNKIPAIVDHDPVGGGEPLSVFESAAIINYLADKADSPLLGQSAREKVAAQEWTMFQMASVGPMFGQAGHFFRYAQEDVPYGKKRYGEEAERLMGVMDRRLSDVPFLAGDNFTVADIVTYPWVHAFSGLADLAGIDTAPFASVGAWLDRVGSRDAVHRGMDMKLTA
ncbi:MAG: glutathione S-transferase N-terminal domain-containing protein [Parvularculaceae bacterium]|nr:glutathione S-transferase N-terminal domain-containing protein [Parvularculaceae bacterium]